MLIGIPLLKGSTGISLVFVKMSPENPGVRKHIGIMLHGRFSIQFSRVLPD